MGDVIRVMDCDRRMLVIISFNGVAISPLREGYAIVYVKRPVLALRAAALRTALDIPGVTGVPRKIFRSN
jgi:hypothetical protein